MCSYSHEDVVTLVLFARDGSVLTLAIGTAPRAQGCLSNPRETTERCQYPLASALSGEPTAYILRASSVDAPQPACLPPWHHVPPTVCLYSSMPREPCLAPTFAMSAGPVTAMAICEQTLCLACQSAETPLITIPLADLASARPSPLRESKTVRQWVSGLLGTSQPPQVACLAALPLSPASPSAAAASPRNFLAVLYTNGLLSVWEAASGRHLCQTIVGSGADGRHTDPNAPPVTVTGMCDSPQLCALFCMPPIPTGSSRVQHCVAADVYTLLCSVGYSMPGCLAVYGQELAFAWLAGTAAFGSMQPFRHRPSFASCCMANPITSSHNGSMQTDYLEQPPDCRTTFTHRTRADAAKAFQTVVAHLVNSTSCFPANRAQICHESDPFWYQAHSFYAECSSSRRALPH